MDTIALILAIIGSVNWGLVGIFRFDLVAWIFGGQAAVISRIIYTLVGLAGLWCITLPPYISSPQPTARAKSQGSSEPVSGSSSVTGCTSRSVICRMASCRGATAVPPPQR